MIRRFLDRFRSPAARMAAADDVEGLLRLAADGSPAEQADAINRLWGRDAPLNPSARERLLAISRHAASDPEPSVRGQALLAIGQLKSVEDYPLLERGLSDPEWFVRISAASTFIWNRPPGYVQALAPLLRDDEELVRDAARDGLRDAAANADDGAIRAAAIQALDEAGLPIT